MDVVKFFDIKQHADIDGIFYSNDLSQNSIKMSKIKIKQTYMCGNGETSAFKVTEGMNAKCSKVDGELAFVGSKCSITCDTGTPTHSEISCKSSGWRITNNIECQGVSAGVIVGAVVGGFIGVVLIALLYAKYKQRKRGAAKKLMRGKASAARRPGRTTLAPSAPQESTSLSHEDNSSSKSSNRSAPRKIKPPSYTEVQTDASREAQVKLRNNGSEYQSNEKRGRRNYSKPQYPPPQQGYTVGYPGQHYTESQFSNYGYQNQGYHQNKSGYTYPTQEPRVGYMGHPQVYPPGREYQRPYNVPT